MTVRLICLECGAEFECHGDVVCGLKRGREPQQACFCKECSDKKGYGLADPEEAKKCYKGIKERVKFT